jgi:TnpA family transposase
MATADIAFRAREGGERTLAMKRRWTTDELEEQWSIEQSDRDLLLKKEKKGRLGLMAQLAFYRRYQRFPEHRSEFAPMVLEHLAKQIDLAVTALDEYRWSGRSGRRHRKSILKLLRVRAFDKAARESFLKWLITEALPREPKAETLNEWISEWLAEAKVDRPDTQRFERLIGTARKAYEEQIFQEVLARLDDGMRERLDKLLGDDAAESEEECSFQRLRGDPGRISLDSLLGEVEKLEMIRKLALPQDILKPFHPELIQRYRRRAATESAWDLGRHPDRIRLSLLTFYCVRREAEIVDSLVELLLQITHKMAKKAKKRVEKEFLAEAIQVRGKKGILYRIAEAAHEHPDGVVSKVIFPVVSAETIAKLVEEYRAGSDYDHEVHSAMRGSYSAHYRRMLPKLLEVLDLRSNNALYRPLLDAIATIKSCRDDPRQYYNADDVPVDGVIRPKWRDVVIEDGPKGEKRINRINYELCVLQSLRERVRCKEVWIAGADRYRNPDEDLPKDFAERRSGCYERLELPLDVEEFISTLQSEMTAALARLDQGMPRNALVRIDPHRKKKPLIVTPLEAQPEPTNITRLKTAVGLRWPMTGLLDILKEADLRIGFTEAFTTAATREMVDRSEVQRRLLLCLYGLGTNAGLKRLSVGNNVTYKELLHTRRRYLDKESLRDATRRVVNATLAVRRPDVWGEGTSSCAADSKKFGAYDQNLMTEWHIRYGGRGVMIYWHVERKAACIYSQLKRCSSSEVASMIEGVLHHGTDMEVERQYVDSKGQTEVAFAFCHLLGFALLPRLKPIASQRLYLPAAGMASSYPNLEPCLALKPIDWDLIRTQYDEMVRYAAALQERTADADAILRRFTRSNVQHPTYRALAELGRAVKTLFLCDYLDSEDLRREIHEGLNVIENWNSANGFIRFGKGGEIATNRLDEQEVSVLTLHLLQSCLVYVNTLMLQRELDEAKWQKRLTEEDLRALTPLIYAHVNPYGSFELDMDKRINLEMKMAS